MSNLTGLVGASTSLDNSFIKPGCLTEAMAEVPCIITVQAVDTNGNDQTSGGDSFRISIDNHTTLVSGNCSYLDADHDNVSGLPITDTMMTDNGDGTYSYTLLLRGTGGRATVSVSLLITGGLWGEYFANISWSGEPAYCQTNNAINFDWDAGAVAPLSQS